MHVKNGKRRPVIYVRVRLETGTGAPARSGNGFLSTPLCDTLSFPRSRFRVVSRESTARRVRRGSGGWLARARAARAARVRESKYSTQKRVAGR